MKKKRMHKLFFIGIPVCVCAVLIVKNSAQREIVSESSEPSEAMIVASDQAAWNPHETGTLPVQYVVEGGSPSVVLPLNFEEHEHWRVAWDLAGSWDLSSCQTIRLKVRVESERSAKMMLYMRSGSGWYTTIFAGLPRERTVVLPLSKFNSEGQPVGWDHIDRVRIAVLREEGPARKAFISALEGVRQIAQVALYRNDSGIPIDPNLVEFVNLTGAALDRLSIVHEVVGDEEVEGGCLVGKQIAILPLNPKLSVQAQQRLEEFVVTGGRLIVCYALPSPLDTLLGLRTTGMLRGADGALDAFTVKPFYGQAPITAIQESWNAFRIQPELNTEVRAVWENRDGVLSSEPAVTSNQHGFYIGHVLTGKGQETKDRLLQAIIGELWPGMWVENCRQQMEVLGNVFGFKSEAELRRAIAERRAISENKAAIDMWLKTADACLSEANRPRLIQTNPAQMANYLAQAQEAFMNAYAASVPPQPDEFRAVWCHSPTGVPRMTWDEAIKRLADSGFNAVIPNMCWGYSAAYTSSVLPLASNATHDALAECLAAGKKHGVDVHVWRVNWRLSPDTDVKLKAELRAADRLQVDRVGGPVDSLCPSNPENQQLELDAMLELARNEDVAGLHFDYIRYPGWGSCFCSGCRERFERRMGSSVTNWPADVMAKGEHRSAYSQFRRDTITQLVAAVSEQARQIRPGIKISAAVFSNWATAQDSIGQDWKLWVEKGYLDFICPMQYLEHADLFEADTKQSAGWVGGRIPLIPGIGATLGLTPDATLEQVLVTRRQADGFILFEYDRTLLKHLDLLKLGATRREKVLSAE